MQIESEKIMKNDDGFTLIELLLAMVIITVGLLGPLSMQIKGIEGNQFGIATTQATLIAEMKLEELETTAYTALPTAACTISDQTQTMGGIDYTWNCTVTAGPLGTSWSTVQLQVSWPGKFGIARSVSITTVRDG